MILAIDVGNTHITMGILDDSRIVGNFRLTTKTTRTSDEYGICISVLLNNNNLSVEDIDDVIISSVVPKLMYSLTNCIRKYIKKEPIVIGPGIKTGIKIGHDNAREVGADRIVNVAYAYHKLKRACIIIDFGTATTFDFVNKNGEFQYTVISPGLEISAQALYGQTAKLPEIEIKKPASILATNTIDGMQAGVVFGYVGQVEYIIKKIKEELQDDDVYVIATGGLGRVIYGATEMIDEFDADIAFKGMNIIYHKNVCKK